MAYRRATIYFLSGTGNSFRVAAWLHEACRERGIDSELVPLDAGRPREEIEASPEQLVALAYPTHGFLPPWSAVKFLLKMPLRRGAHVFTVPTRGCIPIGRVLIPGAAGLASFLPALLLFWKGYRARGAVSLDMPTNMTNLHPPLGKRQTARAIDSAKKLSLESFGRVLAGRRLWLTWNNFYELCWAILLMTFFPLFPLLYLLLGRLFVGKLMFSSNDCRGCGACAKSCPNDAIIMKGRRSRPYWKHNCEACLRCLNTCPRKAVQAGQSWGVLLWFAMVFPLSAFGYRLVREYLPGVAAMDGWLLRELVFCVYYYPAIIAAYWIFSWLIRLRPVNWLFTYTTLTRLYGRYREPKTRRQDLIRGSRARDADRE